MLILNIKKIYDEISLVGKIYHEIYSDLLNQYAPKQIPHHNIKKLTNISLTLTVIQNQYYSKGELGQAGLKGFIEKAHTSIQ